MTVTTGARGSASPSAAPTSSSVNASGSSSAAVTALWPISSTTIMAVSWSSGWLMVTIWPIFIRCLITSDALTAILCASSATVMVSGTCTSMTRCFDRCGLHLVVAMIALVAAAATRAAAPAVAADAARGVAAGRDGLLLGGIAGPAGRQLGRLDFLAGAGAGRCGCAGRADGRCRCRRRACAACPWRRAWPARPWRRPFPAACARPAPSWARTSSSGWPRLRPRPCGGDRPGRRRARLPRRHAPWIRRRLSRAPRPAPRRGPQPHRTASCEASALSVDACGLLLLFAGGVAGRAFLGFALALLGFLALAALFGQVFFLAADQLGLAARFFFAAGQFGLVDARATRAPGPPARALRSRRCRRLRRA